MLDGVRLLDARSQAFAHMASLRQMLIEIQQEAFFDIDAARGRIALEMEAFEQWLRGFIPQYDLADPESRILVSRGEEADKKYKYTLTTRYIHVCACLSVSACVKEQPTTLSMSLSIGSRCPLFSAQSAPRLSTPHLSEKHVSPGRSNSVHIYRKELYALFGIPVPTTVFTVIEIQSTNVCVDWFKIALESKLLAVVMSMHEGLGAGSGSRVLDENLVKMICDMLRSESNLSDTEYGSDIDLLEYRSDIDLLEYRSDIDLLDFWQDDENGTVVTSNSLEYGSDIDLLDFWQDDDLLD
jgi:hypothetical protein